MFSDAEYHFAYQLANAPLRTFPFPHAYVENVFPESFYAQLQACLPHQAELSPIADKRPVNGYPDRYVMTFDDVSLDALTDDRKAFWKNFRDRFTGGMMGGLLLDKFAGVVSERFKDSAGFTFHDELLLINDRSGYALGPHTDSPRKVISLLFYLPADASSAAFGTSIYLPKDRSLRCPGGPHYPHDRFDRLATMPFRPNSAFCFVKTDRSFHGVEHLTSGDRWLLLYDIYVRETAVDPMAKAKVSFSF